MTTLYLVGDVFDRLAELRRRRTQVALVLCSPPFLALRSYLPNRHPLKRLEIGSEATPAAFVDVMLALVAECAHVLAPWGSVALELGDTYAGSGGAGGDYDPDGLRAGQNAFDGSARAGRLATYDDNRGNPLGMRDQTFSGANTRPGSGRGWPMAKSLAGIPEAVMLSLAYGYNVLDRRGPDSPAGRWMIRNFKPWIRSNPPVGALGDKERPATSYVIVATRDPQRFFDLDAVRTAAQQQPQRSTNGRKGGSVHPGDEGKVQQFAVRVDSNAAGAPPRDWCHSVDMVLDAELAARAGKYNGGENPAGSNMGHVGRLGTGDGTNNDGKGRATEGVRTTGAQGVHLRRALERAGILTTLDALDVSPKGYRGAHYAVWPPELVRLLVDEMCPRRVCTVCGQPSRRIVTEVTPRQVAEADAGKDRTQGRHTGGPFAKAHTIVQAERETLGWSECGCPGDNRWQPGTVLDPFAGSGTTLAVCSGMDRDSIGIDIDERNADLARERVGMFLEVVGQGTMFDHQA